MPCGMVAVTDLHERKPAFVRIGEFLGHKDPKSTLIYSALDPAAVAGLERD
jgi:hypothetical protein